MMIENMTIMFEALGGSAEALKKVDPAPVAGGPGRLPPQKLI